MADTPHITVTIYGPDDGRQDVRLEDFTSYLDEVRQALKETERAVTGERKVVTYYTIADLTRGSPATVVLQAEVKQPRPDHRAVILSTMVESLRAIERAGAPPKIPLELFLEYRDLAGRLNARITKARFVYGGADALVSKDLETRIEAIVGPDYTEHGSVTGTLEAVNVHRGNKFWIYPVAGPGKVRCTFRPELLPKVGTAITRHVEVFGALKYKATAAYPHEVAAADIEVHPPANELPTLMALRGMAPGATDGEASEQFLRKLRDAWR